MAAVAAVDVAPVDVEFSLPKFSRLRKGKGAAEAGPEPAATMEPARRKLKFPRLKVKEAAGAKVPEPARTKAPAPAGLKAEAERKEPPKFKAPQVELGLPGAPGLAAALPEPEGAEKQLKVPQLELALPKAEVPEPVPEHRAGLALPAVDVALPSVDVALKLPKAEVPPPAAGAFRIQLPKLGLAAETEVPEGQGRAPGLQAPKVELALPAGKVLEPEGPPKPGLALPSLAVGVRPVDVELPLPKGKVEPAPEPAKLEFPDVTVQVPKLGLPQLGGRAQEGAAERESPKLKAKGPKIKLPSFGLSLREPKAEAEPGAAEGKARLPALKMPSIDIVVPRAADVELPPAPDVRLPTAKLEMPGPEVKFKLPQVSLPKLELAGKVELEPEPEPGALELLAGKIGMPKLDLSVPGLQPVGVELPAAPELGIAVPEPRVEVALRSAKGPERAVEVAPARLSFPSVKVPSLEIDLPHVAGVEYREAVVPEPPSLPLRVPKVDLALGRETAEVEGPDASVQLPAVKLPAVEIAAPTLPGLDIEPGVPEAKPKSPKFSLPKFPRGRKEPEPEPEPGAKGAKLKMPKLGLSFSKAKPGTEGDGGSLELEGKAGAKLPGVEIAAPCADVAVGLPGSRGAVPDASLEAPDGKLKMPKISLPKFGGKGRDGELEPEPEEPGREAKLKMPKFKMPSFAGKRDAEGAGAATPEPEGRLLKGEAGSGSSFLKMPKLTVSAGKAEPGADVQLRGSKGDLRSRGPELEVRLPQVELPKLGAQEAAGTGSPGAGRRPVLGARGGEAEVSEPALRLCGAELQLPKVPSLGVAAPALDLALGLAAPAPELAAEQGGAQIQLPQVELARLGATRDVGTEGRGQAEEAAGAFKLPSVGLPQLSGPKGKAPEPPQLEASGPKIKLPKFGGSSGDVRGEPEASRLELELKPPRLCGSLEVLGPTGEGQDDGPGFKLRMPSFGGAGAGADTQPLCGAELRGRAPQVAFPDVGFSMAARGEDAGGRGRGGAETEAKGARFQVPELELSAPGAAVQTAPGAAGKGDAADGEAGRRAKVKLPKFGLALTKGAPEVGEEAKVKGRKGTFTLGKAREAEAASGLLEGDADAGDGRAKGLRLKLTPGFGLSLAKAKAAAEVNGLEADADKGARLRLPKLGFSKGEGPGLPDGARLGRVKLPRVELAGPRRPGEPDAEMSLELVQAEEAEGAPGGARAGSKLALALSGLRKKDGDGARAEMAEPGAEAEKGARFKLPKLALSPKARGVLEIGAAPRQEEGEPGAPEGLQVRLPKLGFSAPAAEEGHVAAAV